MGQPVSIDNIVEIGITQDKRIEFAMSTATGVIPLTGDFWLHRGQPQANQITFHCARPFKLVLMDFADATPNLPLGKPGGQRGRSYNSGNAPVDSNPPSSGPVYSSDSNNTLVLTVRNGNTIAGIYKYTLIVEHPDGSLVTIDPQIIVK